MTALCWPSYRVVCLFCCTGVQSHKGTSNVADLKSKIYSEVRNAPACVRLLNASGTVGCASQPVSAPLLILKNAAKDHVPGMAAAYMLKHLLAAGKYAQMVGSIRYGIGARI